MKKVPGISVMISGLIVGSRGASLGKKAKNNTNRAQLQWKRKIN